MFTWFKVGFDKYVEMGNCVLPIQRQGLRYWQMAQVALGLAISTAEESVGWLRRGYVQSHHRRIWLYSIRGLYRKKLCYKGRPLPTWVAQSSLDPSRFHDAVESFRARTTTLSWNYNN